MATIEDAKKFAIERHGDQKRKYTGEPYWHHCEEVANTIERYGGYKAMIQVAWLHDVLEDTNTSVMELYQRFGVDVALLVLELTDVAKPGVGNRAQRKAFECIRLSRISIEAKSIKLADIISNTPSIVENDIQFAKVYLQEVQDIIEWFYGDFLYIHPRAQIVVRREAGKLANRSCN